MLYSKRGCLVITILIILLILSPGLHFLYHFPNITIRLLQRIFGLSYHPKIRQIKIINKKAISNGIPKRIHQIGPVFINNTEWSFGKSNWINTYFVNNDYQYNYWTDLHLKNFILDKYPDFYETYISYSYDVQRYDIARLIIVNHFDA